MENNIYNKLFQDEIVWGLHTTYNCDMAYSAELLLKQYKETAIGNVANKDGFAVFYNKSCGLKSTSNETDAKWFKDKFFFALANSVKQTFHAKISLIKYKDNGGNVGYRIAVYSKNHSFGYNCAEVGEVFELELRKEDNNSINMLSSYLDALYGGASEKGQLWLSEKGLGKAGEDYRVLSNCRVVGINNKPVDLYFGGCPNIPKSLGQYIDMSNVNFEDSLIITPPEFIKSSQHCKEFFEQKRCLYDLKEGENTFNSSHEKVYLIKKNDETYHLWFGSANATPHGLGIHFYEKKDKDSKIIWELWDPISWKETSIECLVHQEIKEQEYRELKEQIENTYKVFCDFKKQGSLPNNKDLFANDFAQNCKAEVKFLDNNGNEINNATNISTNTAAIKFELSSTNCSIFKKYKERKDLFQIILAEYKWNNKNTPCTAIVGDVCSELSDGKKVTLLMTVDSYYPIKGTAYVNDDVIMDLIIPQNLQVCVETNPPTYSITLVSDWLQGKSQPSERYNDNKLQWFRDLIVDKKTDVSIANSGNANNSTISSNNVVIIELSEDVELKTEQMQFQKDGTNALLSILEKNSRAFLADEAGLGKTYTSTGVMDTLYEQFQNDSSNNDNRPFYVFYIAPNIPLLSKNCRDIVKKSRHSENIIDLSNLRLELVIKLAVKQKLQDNGVEEECSESISREVYEYLSRGVSENKKWKDLYSQTAIKVLYENLPIPETDSRKKVLTQKDFIAVIREQQLSSIFQKGFKVIDRIAFINKYLMKNSHLFKNKIVLLPISAQLILDNDLNLDDSGSAYEKNIRNNETRKKITETFLEEYSPNMIIWDEYHRYMNKMDDDNNPFMKWEKESHKENNAIPFKALYLSATPYLSNKSDVDSDAEKRYDDWNNKDSKEKIPEFKDFAKLLAGGYSESIEEEKIINDRYNQFINGGQKEELEKILRKRMIRHERSRLQNVYEQHKILDDDSKYISEYADVFINTENRMNKMKKAGFEEGTVNQALNMPYFGSFMYRNKNNKDAYTIINKVNRNNLDVSLFLPDTMDKLPKECLGIRQLIDANIKEDKSSIIWIPPTTPLYDPGENSIYNRYKKYSKTLVFAETIFYQRGYSYLLSRYVDEVANKCINNSGKLKLEYANRVDALIKICDPWKFDNGTSLDKIIEDISNRTKESYTDILASIAAPAVCAKRLGLDHQVYEEYFNKYFQRRGISNALDHWIEKWISENCQLIEKLKLESVDKIYELALLRYCAEGNLLAVLEEWIFVLNEADEVKLSNRFEQVLVDDTNRHTTVYPVSECKFKKSVNADDNLKKECTFAEQLVGDYLDCGSGENIEVKRNLSAKFSSPFWPMIMIAGRGAQEGMDYHEYCLKMMHLTLPTGPVSYEQRQGRIDRFRGLMVRRRVGKYFECNTVDYKGTKKDLLKRQYGYLLDNKPTDNELYANYNMPEDGENYFERMLPFWDFSNESREYHILENRLDSYRSSIGVYKNIDDAINLSADSILNAMKGNNG